MLSMRRVRLLFSICLPAALALSASAGAQGTATLPATDLVYSDLDRLSELSFLDAVIIGQRPYSRREIGRILRVARDRSNRLGERSVSHRITDLELSIGDGLLRRLETRFAREVDEESEGDPVIALLDGVALVTSSTDAELRDFPATHTRPTEAQTGNLLKRRLGSPLRPGLTSALELSQRIEPVGWLAFTARERVQLFKPRDTTLTNYSGELLLGLVRARYRNVALSVGREQVAWAQAPGEGLFLASDAPALDQVSLASDHPFALPGFLRGIGPAKATLLVADLGQSAVRSHSRLLAYKMSIQPTPRAEFGATFMNHYGGAGARSSSATDRLIDFLPFVDIFRRHNYTDTTRALDVESDKLLGIDGRLRVGSLRGVLFTGEMLIDDFDVHRIPQLFTSYGSQTFGITVPRFVSPVVSLKLSAKHMGILTYSHNQLTNGITSRGRLLGEELGPDSKAFAAALTWEPTPAVRARVEARQAIYSNAEYGATYTTSDSSRFVVRKLSHSEDEIRNRLSGQLLIQSEAGPALSLRFVGERSRNYVFQGGRRADYAVELGLFVQQ